MKLYIESKIYELSNNSMVTHKVIEVLKEKLDENELRDFYTWLQIVEQERQIDVKSSIREYNLRRMF